MALPVRRAYAGAPVTTTISANIAANATSVAVVSVTGWPNTFPFFAVIDPGTSKEEKISVTGITSTTLTFTRAADDTSASSHDAGAVIYPVFTATDAEEANLVASTMTTKGDLISTDGSAINRLAVGTNSTVLMADSSSTNGIKWGQVVEAGIADGAVTSAKIADATIAAGDLTVALRKLLCPVGTISAYGGTTAPTGWLMCDGSSIDAGYTELRALVGTTTPDMRGRLPIGDNATLTLLGTGGSLKITEANLPVHKHTINHNHASYTTPAGEGTHSHTAVPAPNFNGNVAVDNNSNILGTNQPTSSTVSSGTAGSGHTHTVDLPEFTGDSGNVGSGTDYYPPYLAVNFIIKHDY